MCFGAVSGSIGFINPASVAVFNNLEILADEAGVNPNRLRKDLFVVTSPETCFIHA